MKSNNKNFIKKLIELTETSADVVYDVIFKNGKTEIVHRNFLLGVIQGYNILQNCTVRVSATTKNNYMINN